MLKNIQQPHSRAWLRSHPRSFSTAQVRVSELTTPHRKVGKRDGVFTIRADTSVAAAAMHLAQHGLTFAMVSDERGGRTLGMVSERDFLRFAAESSGTREAAGQPVWEWMTAWERMPCVTLDTPVDTCLNMIRHRTWRQLPVLDYWGNLHSVLDARDVVTWVLDQRHREQAEQAARLDPLLLSEDGGAGWAGRSVLEVLGEKRRNTISPSAGVGPGTWRNQLDDYLQRKAQRHTVPLHGSVKEAAQQMLSERLAFLVVLEPTAEVWLTRRLTQQKRKVAGTLTERTFLHFASELGAGTRTLDVTTCDRLDFDFAFPKTMNAEESTGAPSLSDMMTPLERMLHVSLADDAAHALDLFFSKNVTHLPVTDRNDVLCGILSIRDLLRLPEVEAADGA